MASHIKTYTRLEPRPYERNYSAGFSAAIHDPVWFLGRQWQMGEHQGENASSPIWINYQLESHQIKAADNRFDPRVIPAEAIIESELFDWWTMGRRIRIGKKIAQHASVQNKPALMFTNSTPPYEHFINSVDGLAVWKLRAELGIANVDFGPDIPEDSTPAWDSKQLLYQQTKDNAFNCDELKLTVNRHHGGKLDWYGVDATPNGAPTEKNIEDREAIPTALQYPGAPNSRWWQIENASVDMGGYVPDSAHTPTAMLTELIFSHSDDWFLFPVSAKAGNVISINKVDVLDVFGRTYSSEELTPVNEVVWLGLQPPQNWTLFQIEGLSQKDIALWHIAELPLESKPVEQVLFGSDEQSNLVWAVERTLDGRDADMINTIHPADPSADKFNSGLPAGDARPGHETEYAYVPGQGIAPYWHPYQIDEDGDARMLKQRRLPNLTLQKPVPMPPPQALVLQPDIAGGIHEISPLSIPSNGIMIERRWHLARDMNGFPILWLQRQQSPLLSPPARLLRFDVMEEAAF